MQALSKTKPLSRVAESYLFVGSVGVSVCGVTAYYLDNLIVALFVFGSFVLPFVFYAIFKRPIYAYWACIFLFYFIPYSSIDPRVRATGNFFSLFSARFSVLSMWDIFMLTLATLLFFRAAIDGDQRFAFFRTNEIWVYLILFVAAFFIGMLHIDGSFLSYGPSEPRRILISLKPVLYMACFAWMTINFVKSEKDWTQTIGFVQIISGLLVVYGIYRLHGILTGVFETMWPFGLPIILYDQMSMFYYPIFLFVSAALLGLRNRWGSTLLVVTMVLFILCSTRRFNYLLLLSGIVGITVFGLIFRQYNLKTVVKKCTKTLGFVSAGILLITLLVPQFGHSVSFSVRSIDMGSALGKVSGGNIRCAEIENLFLNMTERPYTFLTGFGLGTKWRAIAPQPLDRFSYQKQYLQENPIWFPNFHLPYLAIVFRLGLVGTLILCGAVFVLIHRIYQQIRSIQEKKYRAHLMAMSVFVFLTLLNIGDSLNPTMPILAGMFLGLIAWFQSYSQETQSHDR